MFCEIFPLLVGRFRVLAVRRAGQNHREFSRPVWTLDVGCQPSPIAHGNHDVELRANFYELGRRSPFAGYGLLCECSLHAEGLISTKEKNEDCDSPADPLAHEFSGSQYKALIAHRLWTIKQIRSSFQPLAIGPAK